jgi:hypothetical protein
MHDFMRSVMQEGVRNDETYREWLQSSVSLICGAFRHVEDPKLPQRWAECEEFMPHIQSLNQRWSSESAVNLELVGANSGIATYLRSLGRYNEAEELQKQVREAYETELGCEHPSTLTSIYDLALITTHKHGLTLLKHCSNGH